MCSISVIAIASQDKDYKDNIDFEKAGVKSPAMNTAVLAPHAKGLPGKSPADLPPTSSSRLPAILCLLVSPWLSAALWCTLLQAAMMTSFGAVLLLQAHEAFGWSSTGAGLIFLPLLLPCFTGPIIGAASVALIKQLLLRKAHVAPIYPPACRILRSNRQPQLQSNILEPATSTF